MWNTLLPEYVERQEVMSEGKWKWRKVVRNRCLKREKKIRIDTNVGFKKVREEEDVKKKQRMGESQQQC